MQAFTTENLPVSERVPWWNQVVCDSLLDLSTSINTEGTDKRHFSGKLMKKDIGSLSLIDISFCGAQKTHVSRNLSRTRRADDEFALLITQIAGVSHGVQAGRSTCMSPGNMLLYDSRLPHNGLLEKNQSTLILRVPHNEITCRVPYLNDISMSLLDPRKMITSVVRETILSLNTQFSASDMDHDNTATDALLDTIASAALSSFLGKDGNCSSGSAALLWRVKSFIDLHLSNSKLNSEQIASAHSVTVRYLNLLFAREDSSITRWIRKRRLEKCAETLSSPRHMNRNVNDVAYKCGFNNLSYFYSHFKQHYGCTPLEYRLNASISRREPLVK